MRGNIMTVFAGVQTVPVSAAKLESWNDVQILEVSAADYREPEMFGASLFPKVEGPQQMPIVVDVDRVLKNLSR